MIDLCPPLAQSSTFPPPSNCSRPNGTELKMQVIKHARKSEPPQTPFKTYRGGAGTAAHFFISDFLIV
jgi:hypothetical protein